MGTGRHCQVGSRDSGASRGLNGSPTFRVNWLQDEDNQPLQTGRGHRGT